MTRYLISFDDAAMIIPEEDLPDVAEASHAVVHEAKDAGVWIFGGGLLSQRASIVATDGTVTDFGSALSVFFRDPDGLEAEVVWTKDS